MFVNYVWWWLKMGIWDWLCDAEVEDEREFDYTPGSEKGPERWGELNKDWASCNSGNLQSPIDLSNRRVKVIRKSLRLKKKYKPFSSVLKNRGHDISVFWKLNWIFICEINYINPIVIGFGYWSHAASVGGTQRWINRDKWEWILSATMPLALSFRTLHQWQEVCVLSKWL